MSRLDLERIEDIKLRATQMDKELSKSVEALLKDDRVDSVDESTILSQELLELFAEDRVQIDFCR